MGSDATTLFSYLGVKYALKRHKALPVFFLNTADSEEVKLVFLYQ
jgi:hypothetical protein